jgi:hypothetical protein
MRPDELERRLRERLDALGPAPRAELIHVLMLPDFERADRIGEFWGYPESRGKLRHGTPSADTGDKREEESMEDLPHSRRRRAASRATRPSSTRRS